MPVCGDSSCSVFQERTQKCELLSEEASPDILDPPHTPSLLSPGAAQSLVSVAMAAFSA